VTLPEGEDRAKPAAEWPSWASPLAATAAAAGVAGTLYALATGGDEAWWMLLVNFLFWGGIAQGTLVWSAIFRTAQATWTPALNRLGQATLLFLPVSLITYALLWSGRHHWLTWLHPEHAVPHKAWWLNEPFFLGRDLAILVALMVLSAWLVGTYARGEKQTDAEAIRRAQLRLNRIAIATVILYAFGYSILAFDLIMSLEPHWYSSLLGGYYFVSTLYLAMAALILMALAFRGPLGLTPWLGPRRLRDMGNLMLGFALLTTGFFFAQYLTIWYGNLPEDTSVIIRRAYTAPWWPVGAAVLALGYLGPFLALCFPVVKESPRAIGTVAIIALAALWTERWLLVVPSLAPDRLAGLGLIYWTIPVGMAGLLALVVMSALRRHPGVSPLDTALKLSEGTKL
jgi:hypothetical protein